MLWSKGSHGISSSRCLSLQAYTRSYLSLKELFLLEDPAHAEQKRLRALPQPMATKVKGRFITPWASETEKKSRDVFRFLATKGQQKLKVAQASNTAELIKPMRTDRTKCKSKGRPHHTWIGHATCYYQTEGVFFLTDPLWSESCSPLPIIGPKRYVAPPLEIEDLNVDVVLLSHTHYDHLDYQSAVRIGNKALWLVPLGVKDLLAQWGITNCVELDWWQPYQYFSTATGVNIEIIFTPAKHWTARGLLDRNACLWGSFVVNSSQGKFFFTGDSGYCPSLFKQLGSSFGPFDLAAIPIGAYEPRWFMKGVHCNPEEAVQIHLDLQAKRSCAIHWGTFPMADEDPIEPALELARARDIAYVSNKDFFTMRQGETLFLDESSAHDFATVHSDVYGQYLESKRLSNSDL